MGSRWVPDGFQMEMVSEMWFLWWKSGREKRVGEGFYNGGRRVFVYEKFWRAFWSFCIKKLIQTLFKTHLINLLAFPTIKANPNTFLKTPFPTAISQ